MNHPTTHTTPRSSSKPGLLAGPATKKSRQRAFTILEVAFAATIMALAITTTITTLQRGFLSLDSARKLTIAGQILQCEMEKMRMVPWATVNAYPATLDPMPIETTFTSNPIVGSRFTLRRNVEVIPTTTGVGMKQITFTVDWKSYDGRTLSRSYTTYYGQNGLYDYYYNSL